MKHDTVFLNRSADYRPSYTTYLLENSPEINPDRKRPCIIICPGGAYAMTSDREAEAVAIQLNAAGFHAIILRYSVAPAVFPTALAELAKTVADVRQNADGWHIDPNKIIIMGFSAGGHLAASMGVFWNKAFLSDAVGLNNHIFKPNAIILSYPVITSGKYAHQGSFENLLGDKKDDMDLKNKVSLEKHVSSDSPPVFMWHTLEDAVVPMENSMLFAAACRDAEVPFELHIYPKGAHGISLANEEIDNGTGNFIVPSCQIWIRLAVTWIKNL